MATVLLPSCKPGVKLFLLLIVAPKFRVPRIDPKSRKTLALVCSVLEKSAKLIGLTTNLRTLMAPLVRLLLPKTPTTGIGTANDARPCKPVTHRRSGRPRDPVVVPVAVREIVSTVPVLRSLPPLALLSVTTVLLTFRRLAILPLTNVSWTRSPMPVIVPPMFPFLQ